MVVRYNFFACLLLLSTWAHAQPELDKKWMIRTSATIAPSYWFAQHRNTLYINGHLEVYPQSRISLRGDLDIYIPQKISVPELRMNHDIFFGAAYHPSRTAFDPYIGVQQGVAMIRSNYTDSLGNWQKSNINVVPLFSTIAGMNYYVGSYFHFFLSMRYAGGVYLPKAAPSYAMHELRFIVGLGFNLSMLQFKKSN